MKNHKRTTIRLDDELRRKLKNYCIENCKTMDLVISQAINEKIDKESLVTDSDFLGLDDEPYSMYSLYVLDEISSIVGILTARRLFDVKCKMFKISPESFSKNDLTNEFSESFCKTFSLIAREEKVKQLKETFSDLLNG